MKRPPVTSAGLAALALALLIPLALPGAAAVEGGDASGDATVTRTSGAEPPRNRTLSVQLVGNATGEPVADAPVLISNHWHDEEARAEDEWSLRTDGNGTVSVNASDGRVRLGVQDPDWKRLRASFTLQGNLSFELPLHPADGDLAQVTGAVTGADGEPVADARVEVDPVPGCDAKRCEERRTAHEAHKGTVEADGTEIRYRWSPHPRHGYDTTGEDGRYAVAVPPGAYEIRAQADGHLPATVEAEAAANETAEADLALTPIPEDSVTLGGVVRDAETGDPIPGARVVVKNPQWGSRSVAVADEDGAYSVETKPGHVVLQAIAGPGDGHACIMDEGGSGSHDAEEVGDGASTSVAEPEPRCADEGPDQAYLPRVRSLDVAAGETRNATLDLRPEPDPSAAIQGWVLGPDGEPVTDATVRLRNEETGDHGTAGADGNGSFAAEVPAGYHTLVVDAPGYLPTAANVAVEEGETAEVVLEPSPGEAADDLRLRPGVPRIVHDRHHESDGGDAAASGAGDAASASEPTISGGPGGLGPYQAASGPDETASEGRLESVPSAGAALAAATLASAAAGLRRLRSR